MQKASWRPPTQIKRLPVRADSTEIYEAILTATALLAENGAEACSTTAIAKRAGVGVASVYRYFPGREAIMAELHRRLQYRLVEELEVLLTRDALTLEEAVRGVCLLQLKPPGVSPGLRKTLVVEVPLSWSDQVFDALNLRALQLMVSWLMHYDPVRFSDETRVSEQVLLGFGAVRGIAHIFALHPDNAPAPERALAEATRMVYGYFAGQVSAT